MKASVFKVLSLTETVGVEEFDVSLGATTYGSSQGLTHKSEGSATLFGSKLQNCKCFYLFRLA